MEPELETAALLQSLEDQLLNPETRRSADQVSSLLADEFIEFGSSGRVFDKSKTIESLQLEQHEKSIQRSITDFSMRRLAPDIALVTYRLAVRRGPAETGTHTLRSSIWKSINGQWKMIFHQGTLTSLDR